jgi:hypothetical protein
MPCIIIQKKKKLDSWFWWKKERVYVGAKVKKIPKSPAS